MTAKRIETPAQLRKAIARLSSASPLTDRFSTRWRALRRSGGEQREKRSVWYSTQQEHWDGWLRGYEGPGAYGRVNWSRSAEFVYNHVVNPQMLVYVAEAAGIERDALETAIEGALTNRATMSAMSGAVRRAVRWSALKQALLAKG
jgi:hypothetical protein